MKTKFRLQKMVKIVIIYRYTLYFQTFSFAVTARTSVAFFVPFEQYFTQKYTFLITRNILVTEKFALVLGIEVLENLKHFCHLV